MLLKHRFRFPPIPSSYVSNICLEHYGPTPCLFTYVQSPLYLRKERQKKRENEFSEMSGLYIFLTNYRLKLFQKSTLTYRHDILTQVIFDVEVSCQEKSNSTHQSGAYRRTAVQRRHINSNECSAAQLRCRSSRLY